jgi:hypothetical protein
MRGQTLCAACGAELPPVPDGFCDRVDWTSEASLVVVFCDEKCADLFHARRERDALLAALEGVVEKAVPYSQAGPLDPGRPRWELADRWVQQARAAIAKAKAKGERCPHAWHSNPALITPCPECGAGG